MKRIRNFLVWLKADQRRMVIGAVIVVLIGLGGWKFLSGRKAAGPQYQTAQVTKGTLVSTVSASGQIVAGGSVDVTTSANGIVNQVYVKEGQKVVKGQMIAQLSLDGPSQAKAASSYASYLSAQNAVASANANLYTLQNTEFAANQKLINDAVARNLATTDPTYIQENAAWLAAEANYKNQANVISQAQAALFSSWMAYQQVAPTVYAPMSGVVTTIAVAPGAPILNTSSSTSSTSQRIATVASDNKAIASVNLSEIDVANVKTGQDVTVTMDSQNGKTFAGKILSVDRTGGVSSNVTSYPVLIGFDAEGVQIYPNMSANASIITSVHNNVLMVPSTAIQTSGGQSYVRVLENGQPTQVNVETGSSSDAQTEITSGLSTGQEVITGTTAAATGSTGRSIFSGGFGGGAVFRAGGGGR